MRTQHPVSRTMKASDVRQQWSQVLHAVYRKEARVLVEKSGIPVAAIVSVEDLERLNRLDEEHERDVAVLDEIGEAFKDVPVEELERQVAKALAEVRAERRAERIKKHTIVRSA